MIESENKNKEGDWWNDRKRAFFWNKLLELAKEELTQATFDYYVLDTKLIKVQNNVATILLEEVKKLFWEKNMQSFILMAGFEAYNSEIKVEYVFDEALINEANSTVANNDFGNKKEQQTPALPTLDSDLNSKYTFDNLFREMKPLVSCCIFSCSWFTRSYL